MVKDGVPLIRVSKQLGIPARTIRRHRDNRVKTAGEIKFGRPSALPVHVEKEIHDHVVEMENVLYGLTPRELRRQAARSIH